VTPPPSVAVAAPNDSAAEAGARTAAAGGNAIDAALAAALVTMVNEVGIVSLSSGAFVTVLPPDGTSPQTVDGWVEMPGRTLGPDRIGGGTWDVTTAYGGGVTTAVGPGSVGSHGSLAAFGAVHARWGKVPWAEVVAPARETAVGGFALSSASRHYLEYAHRDIFGWDPVSRAVLHDDAGQLRGPDHLIVVPGLADSLEAIARNGAQEMYDGELGAAIADAVGAGGGLLTRADLAAYAPVTRPSLAVQVRDWELATSPPPSIGGVCIAAILRLLGDRPHGAWSEADTALLVRVQHAVLRHRVDELDAATDVAAAAQAFLDEVDAAAPFESGSTAHVSAVDVDGAACSVTVSSGYSSGMVAPGTGIWLNNCLGEPELNRHGLHAHPPGTRLLSNMAPTVGRTGDGRVLAAGSPGADRISTALAQVLAGFVGGTPLADAIDHPRLHVRVARSAAETDLVQYEEGLVLPETGIASLAMPARTMYFGGVSAALFEPVAGLSGAADPRRGGAVRVR